MSSRISLRPGVFTPGRVYVSREAQEALTAAREPMENFVQRHIAGEYGTVPRGAWAANDNNVMDGCGEIASAYTLFGGAQLQVVTSTSREVTEVTVRGKL